MKILAVDFDNTLFHLNAFPDNSTVRLGNRVVHWYVRRKKQQGWHVVLNTCRHDDALEYAIGMIRKYALPIDMFNENHQALIDKYGDCRKIACDRSLDDTQIGLVGWLLRRFC